ncbi:hypothetical protein KKH14_00250 [Patescibacteria group bacterium]|nr:hypothetical protein [Patescibacteria group bacterium]
MTTIEIMALIVASLVGIKLLVILINPKSWMVVIRTVYAKPKKSLAGNSNLGRPSNLGVLCASCLRIFLEKFSAGGNKNCGKINLWIGIKKSLLL